MVFYYKKTHKIINLIIKRRTSEENEENNELKEVE
jgi:hypothetical protein